MQESRYKLYFYFLLIYMNGALMTTNFVQNLLGNFIVFMTKNVKFKQKPRQTKYYYYYTSLSERKS